MILSCFVHYKFSTHVFELCISDSLADECSLSVYPHLWALEHHPQQWIKNKYASVLNQTYWIWERQVARLPLSSMSMLFIVLESNSPWMLKRGSDPTNLRTVKAECVVSSWPRPSADRYQEKRPREAAPNKAEQDKGTVFELYCW